MRRLSVFVFILFVLITILYGQNSGMDYYLAGIRAYQVQDCKNAVNWLEEALAKDPDIEVYDPEIKLKIGVCAYRIGDYDKAKAYLSLFPNNALAKNLLELIKEGKHEEEWEKWLMVEKPTPQPVATTTQEASPVKESKFPSQFSYYLLVIGMFFVIFAVLTFLEWKFGLITSFILKALGGSVTVTPETYQPKEVAEEIEAKPEASVEEKELEFDLEEIMNARLDVIDRLIYGDEGFIEEEEVKEITEEKEEAPETTEEMVEAPEEESGESEKEEVMAEIAEAVQEKKETLTDSDEDEVERKAVELLKELEELEDFINPEDAGKTLEEMVEELESKDKYSPEDAKRFLYLIEQYIKSKKEEEAQV